MPAVEVYEMTSLQCYYEITCFYVRYMLQTPQQTDTQSQAAKRQMDGDGPCLVNSPEVRLASFFFFLKIRQKLITLLKYLSKRLFNIV